MKTNIKSRGVVRIAVSFSYRDVEFVSGDDCDGVSTTLL